MANTKWTKEKIELLRALSENPELTKSIIARRLKTTVDAIDHAQRRYDIKHVVPEMESNNYANDFYGVHTGMIYSLKDILKKATPYKLEKLSSKKVGDTLNIQLSDWHVGRTIKDEQGQTIYDVSTFKTMVDTYATELLKLLDKYISKGTPVKEVVIMSTGDICDGAGIFASQETLSELSPPFQVTLAVESIQKIILALLDRKLKVTFYGVKGNHGNIKVHGKVVDPNANWDLMLYLMLDFWARDMLKSDKLVIKYSELDYYNFNNRGWNYHIRHIAPNQSETSAGKAKFLGWAKKHNFDVLVYGHFHHWGAWDRSKITVIRGGALTASDEFAELLAEESQPIQMIWGCNEKRPVTFIYPLDLGKKEKRK